MRGNHLEAYELNLMSYTKSFGLREGDVEDEHGEVGRSAAAAWAGSTRLNGEGLLEDDDVLDVGVHGALACLGQNGGQAGEEEVAAMLRKVVAWFGAAPADREAWLEFAGVVER
uniref:Uncharacterized protein n=1 Tax=Oryza sativa subsp. japonica TaxID=39947 RepID=Q69PP1_ORYSJ|nr:hypothetical protein [Oryza sativa Japonica Group]